MKVVIIFVCGVAGFILAIAGAASIIGERGSRASDAPSYYQLIAGPKFKKQRSMIIWGLIIDATSILILFQALPHGHR